MLFNFRLEYQFYGVEEAAERLKKYEKGETKISKEEIAVICDYIKEEVKKEVIMELKGFDRCLAREYELKSRVTSASSLRGIKTISYNDCLKAMIKSNIIYMAKDKKGALYQLEEKYR